MSTTKQKPKKAKFQNIRPLIAGDRIIWEKEFSYSLGFFEALVPNKNYRIKTITGDNPNIYIADKSKVFRYSEKLSLRLADRFLYRTPLKFHES